MSGVFLVFIFAFAESNFGADNSFFKVVREGHMVIKCEEKVC